jgi:hypothetical protein
MGYGILFGYPISTTITKNAYRDVTLKSKVSKEEFASVFFRNNIASTSKKTLPVPIWRT